MQVVYLCRYFLTKDGLSCLTFHDVRCQNIQFIFQMPSFLYFPLIQFFNDYLYFVFREIQQAIFSCLIHATFKSLVKHVQLLILLTLLSKYQVLRLFQSIHFSFSIQILHDKPQFSFVLYLFLHVLVTLTFLFLTHKITSVKLNFLLIFFVKPLFQSQKLFVFDQVLTLILSFHLRVVIRVTLMQHPIQIRIF